MKDVLDCMKNRYPSFSKGQKKIADFIFKNYEKAAFMTAQKLGSAVKTSESTVVRFAAELGCEGYGEFQKLLQELIRNKLTALQRMEVASERIGNKDIIENVMQSDLENIKHTVEEIDKQAFDDAVETLLGAKHIYILGVRSSAALANFIGFYFNMIFDSVHLVQTNSVSEMFEQILRTGPEDAVVAISFPRYSRRTVKAAEFAASRKSKVIAITDSESSPITPYATHKLIARSEMAYFVDSCVAPFSLANALIVALGLRKKDEVYRNFEYLESLWEEYEVYEKY